MRYSELFEDKRLFDKLFYHGTKASFDHFDLDFIGKGNDQNGPGFYFTDNIESAALYAGEHGTILACHLSPRKIIKSNGKVNISAARYILNHAPNLKDTLLNWDENFDVALRNALHSMIVENNPKETFERIWYDFYRDDAKLWALMMMKFQYDAIAIVAGEDVHVIMLNPDRIKIVSKERKQ